MVRDWVGLLITAVIFLSLYGAGYTFFKVNELCSTMGLSQWLLFTGPIFALVCGRSTAQRIPATSLRLMVVTGVLAVLTSLFPLAAFWLYTGASFYLWFCLLIMGSTIAGFSSLLGTWWFEIYADQRWMNRIQYRGYSHISLVLCSMLAIFIGLIFPSIGFVRMGFVWLPCFLFLMLVWMDIEERFPTLLVLGIGLMLVAGWGSSLSLISLSDERTYPDSIIVQDRSKPIVVTKNKEDLRLYVNGNLRFSSVDAYRYYETLVHVPSVGDTTSMRNVLVLGAEGGLLVQEVLKYETVARVDVVEHLGTAFLVQKTPILRQLHHHVFDDERVQVHDTPLFDFIFEQTNKYDAIFMDLPESGNAFTARYYEQETLLLLLSVLEEDGFLVTQAGSPFFSPLSFWNHVRTISSLDKHTFVYPYHTNVPSFGEWGFVILSRRERTWDDISLPNDLRFLTTEMIPFLFSFSNDMLVSESG